MKVVVAVMGPGGGGGVLPRLGGLACLAEIPARLRKTPVSRSPANLYVIAFTGTAQLAGPAISNHTTQR